MTDENEVAEGSALAATEATAPAPKKKRVPRRAKVAVDAAMTSEPVKAEKVVKERKKRGPKTTQLAKPATDVTELRGGRKPRTMAKAAESVATRASSSAADEMADLMQLEEENKRLRQTLAEKLRAENADLRKRLGLA